MIPKVVQGEMRWKGGGEMRGEMTKKEGMDAFLPKQFILFQFVRIAPE